MRHTPFLFTVLPVHGCAGERGQHKKRKQEKSEVKSMASLWLVTKSGEVDSKTVLFRIFVHIFMEGLAILTIAEQPPLKCTD